MRIRKNLLRVPSESGTHLCQLNQSPWDVITTLSSPTPLSQVQEDESFFEHKAFESVASLKIFSAGGDDNSCLYDEEQEKEAVNINYCAKTDQHGNWICGLEAKEGVTFCEFHLGSYIAPVVHPVTKKSSSNKISEAKKSKSESNTYKDLYYYDGFGPSWGKRRVARELSKASENVAMQLPSNSEDEQEDDMEEDVQVENGNDNGKKRGRKRIKARSLKSLM